LICHDIILLWFDNYIIAQSAADVNKNFTGKQSKVCLSRLGFRYAGKVCLAGLGFRYAGKVCLAGLELLLN
jgi:predicted transcriptional regulator with HTH domain